MTETDTVRLKFTSKTLYDLVRESTGLILFPAKTAAQLNAEIFNVLHQGYLRAKYERIGKKEVKLPDNLALAEKIFVLYVEKHLGIEGLKTYCDSLDVSRHLPAGQTISTSAHLQTLTDNKRKISELAIAAKQGTLPSITEPRGIFKHDYFTGLEERLMFADSQYVLRDDTPTQDRFLPFRDAQNREIEYRDNRVLHDFNKIFGNPFSLVAGLTDPGIITAPFHDFDAGAESRNIHFVRHGENLDARLKGQNQVLSRKIKVYAQDDASEFLRNHQDNYPVRLVMMKIVEETKYARKVSSSELDTEHSEQVTDSLAQNPAEQGRHTRKEYYNMYKIINGKGSLNHVLTFGNPVQFKDFEGRETEEAQIKAKVGRASYKRVETYFEAEINTTYMYPMLGDFRWALTSRRFSGKNNANAAQEFSLELSGGNGLKDRISKILKNPNGPYQMADDEFRAEYLPSNLYARGRALGIINPS